MNKTWRFGIIGGGPAGSLFAHFALRQAQRWNLPIKITIFDGKSFLKNGPPGCNLCAGVVSRHLQQLLQNEGIFLPAPRIMSWVDGYVLHAGEEELYLSSPSDRTGRVATVFRGNGPRYARFPEIISFDDFLLSWAQDMGAQVIPYHVKHLRWSKEGVQPLSLQYGDDKLKKEEEFDWIIGAFGVNTSLGQKLSHLGYIPPQTRLAFQAEFKFSLEIQENFINNKIHIFIPRQGQIRYASLIPKGQFTTLTIIGRKDVQPNILEEFFNLEEIKKRLPFVKPTCFCFPRIVTGSCRWPRIPHFLIVGDAAFCRYYKNGLESAFISAKLAAEAIFSSPKIGNPSKIYYHQARKLIIADNFYGRLLFRLNHFIISLKPIFRLHLYLAQKEKSFPASRLLTTILWDFFTGERPYRQIFKSCFQPKLQWSLFLAFFSGKGKKKSLRQYLSPGADISSQKASSPDFNGSREFNSNCSDMISFKNSPTQRISPSLSFKESPSLNGKTIAIIGGGPAGAAFGIKLLSLARKKGEKPRVVIFEGKPLDKKSHYNQCLGVLSPPLPEIMEKSLGIPFPWSIIQKTILGYYLHTEKTTLHLPGSHEPSYACRRVEFDSYLFNKALEAGAEIVRARVIDLDILDQGIMVYSESNNLKADGVVGAFGLDDGMIKILERLTSYRQPEFLTSIVTKFHPGLDAVEAFGQCLHVFLLKSILEIEFAAITPKGNHLSLNIAGKNVNASSMELFLRSSKVRKVLPPGSEKLLPSLSFYKGKFPTGPARNFLLDRIIMIGDAAGLNRPFKGKGINSALLTAIRAAEALVQYGFTEAMKKEYDRLCSDLISDLPYGQRLRWLTLILTRLGLMDGLLELAPQEPALLRALFHIVSGQKAYRTIWQEENDLRLLLRMAVACLSSRRPGQERSIPL